MSEDEIAATMHDLAEQQVKQVFVHPRPGLMTPYLSEEWFRMWRAALRAAKSLDMNVWIYDENSYPSGFAGGLVPELMPESRGRGLVLKEGPAPGRWEPGLLAVYRRNADQFEDVSALVRGGKSVPEGPCLVASIVRAGNSPWHGDRSYVDLLYPGVTEKFLKVTLDAYAQQIGYEFGKRVPGVFSDEAEIRPAGGLPWTEDLPQVFQKRWGYSLLDQLPSLKGETGDWRRVRHNYLQVLCDLFVKRWAQPYSEYCEKHHLEWTGHYWEHEWPNCLNVPDNMAMYAWHQRPAIDILMNQYHEDVHAQFGNARAVRELASVANQLGKTRTLCEGYGAGGWDLRFEDMKRIGDWLAVLGVNTLDQHLSYATIRGARKRDHPQSFSYHEPWWPAYHISASYFARLSAALSQGEQVNSILVMEPTTTAWMYQNDAENSPRLAEMGNAFQKLVMDFERAQVEYDIGSEDILARHGEIGRGGLRVSQRTYGTVVLAPFTENLNASTVRLLEQFLQAGGTVICAGHPPERIDGASSGRGAELAKSSGWHEVEPAKLLESVVSQSPKLPVTITRVAGDQGILFHHRRRIADGQILFLVNSSSQQASAGTIESEAGGVERWDLATGRMGGYPCEKTGNRLRAQFDLPPSGSLLLFLGDKPRKLVAPSRETIATIQPSADPEVRRLAPNVLVLDYVDVTAGQETRTNTYFYQAGQFAFQKNGLPRNPWDSAVQFSDRFLRYRFLPDSGFTATYRFTVQDSVPSDLAVVVEQPDRYAITCNGKPVAATKGAWWLDRSFGVVPVNQEAQVGENWLTIQATPFTIYHEIEPVYLLGGFALESSEHGFVIRPERGLKLGDWNGQGMPFYSDRVSYRERFDLPATQGRYLVEAPSWYGSVAEVVVNGRSAGFLSSPPWQCDVTKRLKPGTNWVDVVVIGTLKNTLGPHHGKPGLGSAWPGMFQHGPNPGPPAGTEYSTVGYGLRAPFHLLQINSQDTTPSAVAKAASF